jgi:hypothetical protein
LAPPRITKVLSGEEELVVEEENWKLTCHHFPGGVIDQAEAGKEEADPVLGRLS